MVILKLDRGNDDYFYTFSINDNKLSIYRRLEVTGNVLDIYQGTSILLNNFNNKNLIDGIEHKADIDIDELDKAIKDSLEKYFVKIAIREDN